MKSFNFAAKFIDIDKQTMDIIQHARKSLLFHRNEIWIKKNNPDFDVIMGSFDGAEICELVGLFLLSKIKSRFTDINFGLYRDDGLGVTRNLSRPQADRLRKDLKSFFKKIILL